jgi:hypothetical protein
MFITKGAQHNYLSGPKGGRVLLISPAGLENTLQAWLTTLARTSFTLRKKRRREKEFFLSFALQEPEHYGAVYNHSNGAVLPATKTSDPSLFNKAQDGKLFG